MRNYPGVVSRDSRGHCTACGCKPHRKKLWSRKVAWGMTKDGMRWRLLHRAKSYRIQQLRQIPGMGRYAWFDVQKIACTPISPKQRGMLVCPWIAQEDEVARQAWKRRMWEHEQNILEPCPLSNSMPCESSTGPRAHRWRQILMRGWRAVTGSGRGVKPSTTASRI